MKKLILYCVRVTLFSFAGASGAVAPAPETGGELLGLHKQFSIPDCVFEYAVHLQPLIEGVGQLKYRFTTKGGMWRIDRLDDRSQTTDTWCCDGSKYFVHHRRGNMLIILPGLMEYSREIFSEFSFHPLANSAMMPFFGSKTEFKIPDISSPSVWADVLAKNSIRPVAGQPPNEAHFAVENSEVWGVMKLAKGGADMPPWLVKEQSWTNRQNNASVTLTHSDWRRFMFPDGASVLLPSKVVSRGSGGRYPPSETITELLTATVKKLPADFPNSAFRIPRSSVPNPYDRTLPGSTRESPQKK